MTDKRYKVGIWITVAYVVVLGAFAYLQRAQMSEMKPNEWGDFLAGAASPLAFLWLVLGYLQQGEELKQNTEALNLQVQELKASVDQQKALVETTQLQHQFELNRDRDRRLSEFLAQQPVLNLELVRANITSREDKFYMTVTNVGRSCSRIVILSRDDALMFEPHGDDHMTFPEGSERLWTLQFPLGYSRPQLGCVIQYTDVVGGIREQHFTLIIQKYPLADLMCFLQSQPTQVIPWEDEQPTS